MHVPLLAFGLFYFAMAWAELPTCPEQTSAEPVISKGMFGLFRDHGGLAASYSSLYESGRRLPGRVHFDSVVGYVSRRPEGLVRIPPHFIQSVTRHVELALSRGYADFLFYPDMGHGHIFVTDEHAIELDAIADPVARFERMLTWADSKMLYHTAELVLLKGDDPVFGPLPTDPWLAWRYHSRNIWADNAGGENLAILYAPNAVYNTVRQVRGYVERGTFYLSASKAGCFTFHSAERVHYFDMTLGSWPSSARPWGNPPQYSNF
jgi:hypothetical protein